MSYDNCRKCQPGRPCIEHRVVADGQCVRVPLAMMDSMQRELHDHALEDDAEERERRRSVEAQLRAIQEHRDRVQAYADHFTQQREEREAAEASARSRERAY